LRKIFFGRRFFSIRCLLRWPVEEVGSETCICWELRAELISISTMIRRPAQDKPAGRSRIAVNEGENSGFAPIPRAT